MVRAVIDPVIPIIFPTVSLDIEIHSCDQESNSRICGLRIKKTKQ